ISVMVPTLLLACLAKSIDVYTLLGLTLAFWIVLSSVKLILRRAQQRGWLNLGQSFWGMILAHCGVAATVIGIAVSTGYGMQDDVKMAPGETIDFAGYKISFLSESPLVGANYRGSQTKFLISSNGKESRSSRWKIDRLDFRSKNAQNIHVARESHPW